MRPLDAPSPEIAVDAACRLVAYAASLLALAGDDASASRAREAVMAMGLEESPDQPMVQPALAVSLMHVALAMLDGCGHGDTALAARLQGALDLTAHPAWCPVRTRSGREAT